jgi:hypothetical protein
MTKTLDFYEIAPRTAGFDRLVIYDLTDSDDVWPTLRDLVQQDLALLDNVVLAAVPGASVRPGSNGGGGARLFAYRRFEPVAGSGIDPVVVGVLVRPVTGLSADHVNVSGDIAGELSGDILFESPPQEAVGRNAMTEAARDIASKLARQADVIAMALQDTCRRE